MTGAAARMDEIYRIQRHFYDITRKPYLLGRDALIEDLNVPHQGTVLEIGCGTARNLVAIARRYPSSRCFGIDVSAAMMQTAHGNIRKAGLESRIKITHADATTFEPGTSFAIDHFDRVVFSFVLSMIPEWQTALKTAGQFLAEHGELHVADFGDQKSLPRWFRYGLNHWLRLFDVTPRLGLALELQRLSPAGVSCRSIYGGYAVVGKMMRA